ncbi:MAG TPA: integrin alpha, partial [Planctomycetota bacterium]
GDGTLELAAGGDGDSAGSVWILSLAFDASVARALEIGRTGGLGGGLDHGDAFGAALAPLGDLDGDGTLELAVGAPADGDGAPGTGAVWILSLAPEGTLTAYHKIGATSGGLVGPILTDGFGTSLAALGDVNGDGVGDLAVGAPRSADGGTDSGAVWILFLAADGTVSAEQKLSELHGGLASHPDQRFGAAVAALGDLDGDGTPDLAVGAERGSAGGAVHVLFLAPDGTVQDQVRHSSVFGSVMDDELGASLTAIGDWDGDGRPDFLVGAPRRDGAPIATDFSDVPAAIAAAGPGDTVLVHGGSYALGTGTEIDGKSLALVASHPGNVALGGDLSVVDLGAAQSVQLSGLGLFADDMRPALSLANNDGRIWIDDCEIAFSSFFANPSQPALLVSASDSVVLCGSQVRSGVHAASGGPQAAAGMVTFASRVYAYDTTFQGADGQGGEAGGAGIVASAASDFLYLSGCTVQGGDGTPSPCQAGGRGLQTVGQAKVLDSSLSGGTGCPDGAASTGNLQLLSGASLALSVDGPTRFGEDTTMHFEGPPGAGVFVLYSPGSNPRYRPALQGAYLVGNSSVLEYAGRLGPDGRLSTVAQLGLVPPGLDVVRLHVQAYYQLPASGSFPGKLAPYPRLIQLGAGAVVHRLAQGF